MHALPADEDGFQSQFFAKRDHLVFQFSYTVDDEGKRVAGAASGLLLEQRGVEVKFSRDDREAAKLETTYRRKHPETKKR